MILPQRRSLGSPAIVKISEQVLEQGQVPEQQVRERVWEQVPEQVPEQVLEEVPELQEQVLVEVPEQVRSNDALRCCQADMVSCMLTRCHADMLKSGYADVLTCWQAPQGAPEQVPWFLLLAALSCFHICGHICYADIILPCVVLASKWFTFFENSSVWQRRNTCSRVVATWPLLKRQIRAQLLGVVLGLL